MDDSTRAAVALLASFFALGCGDDDDTGGGGQGGGDGGTTVATTSTTGAAVTSVATTGAGGDGGGETTGAGGEGGGVGGGSLTPEPVALELIVDGMTSPLVARRFPDGSGRLVVADQTGIARIVDEDGVLLDTPFLDLTSRIVPLDAEYDERGLLGLAFHADFDENGRIYVFYSAPLREGAPEGFDHTNRIAELTVSDADPDVVDLASERVLLDIDQPQGNHNAGQIEIGPDGYLYIPIGDGGAANDVGLGHVEDWYDTNPGGNGQDLTQNLLGSILRIDVDGDPYDIPADNPFADGEDGLPEIWAYGFRNPYRIAFDPGGDNQLFSSDAGQDLWEEINIVEAGANHGWNVREGMHCFNGADPAEELPDCPMEDALGAPLIDPIVEYLNAQQPGGLGFVSIGGHVYRGTALPELDGHYIFGDATRDFEQLDGTLFVAAPPLASGEPWTMAELPIADRPDLRLGEMVKSFGQDEDGEIFILTSEVLGPAGTTGKVYRIVPAD